MIKKCEIGDYIIIKNSEVIDCLPLEDFTSNAAILVALTAGADEVVIETKRGEIISIWKTK